MNTEFMPAPEQLSTITAKPLPDEIINGVKRHRIVRIAGGSQSGGTPDELASKFIIEAGFVAERGATSERAYLGASPLAHNLFLDLFFTPNQKQEGTYKIIRTGTAGANDQIIERGVLTDVQKTATRIIISGEGSILVTTQIVVESNPVKSNGHVISLPATLLPLSRAPLPTALDLPNKINSLVVELPLEQVEEWPDQPRLQFKEKPLEELASSMKGLTQVQPIMVRPFFPGEPRLNPQSLYQIIDGGRRYKAAVKNKAPTIKCIIVHPKDLLEQHRLSVIANLNRAGHSHFEILREILFQYKAGRKPEEIAADFSYSVGAVYGFLQLSCLKPELLALLNPLAGKNKLSFQMAKILATVVPEKQMAILDQAKQEGKKMGQRGIIVRLQELADDNRAETGFSGKRRSMDVSHVERTTRRALAAVNYNAKIILRMAEKFRALAVMQQAEARAEVVEQIKTAQEALQLFRQQLQN